MKLTKTLTPAQSVGLTLSARLRAVPMVLQYLFMGVLIVTMITPFLWMLSTSLKPEAFVLESTPNLIPSQISFEGYRQLAERIDLTRAFFNSILVSGLGTFGQVLV